MKQQKPQYPSYFLKLPCSRWHERFLSNLLIKILKRYMPRTYTLKYKFTGPRPRMTNQFSTTKQNATHRRVYIENSKAVIKWRKKEQDLIELEYKFNQPGWKPDLYRINHSEEV